MSAYDLAWGQGLADKISKDPQFKTQSGRIRLDPPLIPIVPGTMSYQSTVQSFRLAPGSPYRIQPSKTLAPVKISLPFVLAQQQFADEILAARLPMRPASDLAFAEDVILLHGSRAGEIFKQWGIEVIDEDKTLDQQEGLFKEAPKPLAKDKSVVDSILEGLQRLQSSQQHGPYCVILSPDLHREAMTPLRDSGMARIAPILQQLRENGLRFSEAASERTGVVFSLGGAALDLTIPWDAHVECREVKGEATFVVVEQFCLRINDARAVVTLT
ncbi:hypothetical protein EON80_00270 [bacterium]|nr:MAG: hypothetical protein EON80_00270 [bacterium]